MALPHTYISFFVCSAASACSAKSRKAAALYLSFGSCAPRPWPALLWINSDQTRFDSQRPGLAGLLNMNDDKIQPLKSLFLWLRKKNVEIAKIQGQWPTLPKSAKSPIFYSNYWRWMNISSKLMKKGCHSAKSMNPQSKWRYWRMSRTRNPAHKKRSKKLSLILLLCTVISYFFESLWIVLSNF